MSDPVPAPDVQEDEIVIDEKALSQISTKVGESLLPQLDEKMKAGQEDILAKYLEKKKEDDPVDPKAGIIRGAAPDGGDNGDEDEEADADDPVAQGLKAGKFSKEVMEMLPAQRFARGMAELHKEQPDRNLIREISNFNIATQVKARKELVGQEAVAKAGYANETVDADGGVLVPDAEFVAQVYDNLPNYGVAFSDADVRQTDRTAVRVISLDSGLVFYATAEAGVKTGAKIQFSKQEVDLNKYAVIVPATDELTDDAAIDYWNVVTRELTRAYAKLVDEIVFINATTGITNQSGVLAYSTGADDSVLTWDDLLNAEAKTEDDLDESNNKWYMRKETWFSLIQTKGTTNDHYIAGSIANWQPNPNQPTTPWGTPVKYTRVLPKLSEVSNNDAFAVYGDLRNYIVYNKRGMAITMANTGIVKDSEGTDLNLFTQDATAMRAVVRVLGILPKGNRSKFVIVGPGTVS